MKGTISKRLDSVLRDNKASKQLRESLSHGHFRKIEVNNTSYRVSLDSSAAKAKTAK